MATIIFTALFVVGPIAIEIARSVVHAKRERATGIGGTQDIAMWGSFATVGFGLLAAVCWVVWFASK